MDCQFISIFYDKFVTSQTASFPCAEIIRAAMTSRVMSRLEVKATAAIPFGCEPSTSRKSVHRFPKSSLSFILHGNQFSYISA